MSPGYELPWSLCIIKILKYPDGVINLGLMKGQKNDLLMEIKRTELDPLNFEWQRSEDKKKHSGIIDIFKYKGTDYIFAVNIPSEHFVVVYSPGHTIFQERVQHFDWESVVYTFRNWLNYLSREISQPDLWEELEEIKINATFEYEFEYETENGMQQFTYQQVVQIEKGINDIREYLLEQVDGKTDEINHKLDYLIDASKRMGRTDWKNVFFGALMNIFTTIGLDPVQREAVVALFQSAVTGILKLVN